MGEGDRVARERDAMDRVQDMVEVKVKERERETTRASLSSFPHLLIYSTTTFDYKRTPATRLAFSHSSTIQRGLALSPPAEPGYHVTRDVRER